MITAAVFGTDLQGNQVRRYQLRDDTGCGADFLDYGCIIQSVLVPDHERHATDICLGYDTLDGYLSRQDYMGAVLGRHANRIAGARFLLNGQGYRLSENDGANHIHGGYNGFHRRKWAAQIIDDYRIRFSRTAADGEEGYPGNLEVSVEYSFADDCLTIAYQAVSDADTIVNLSNHSYFDLSGGRGDVLSHWLEINADFITENDAQSLPTGTMRPVAGTAFDFRKPHQIGERIHWPDQQLIYCGGYDHDFALKEIGPAATIWHEASGIRMKVYTDMPSLELYTANSLDSSTAGKHGRVYNPRSGICVETQYFPNSMACPRVSFADTSQR